jgi:hypothetical protein
MKRSRFVSNIKYPSISIESGSMWIRQLKISPINHPLIIQIQRKMDVLGRRYEAVNRESKLYLDRETIIENYQIRDVPEVMPIDWQIAEIKGYRLSQARGEVWAVGNYENAPTQPANMLKPYIKSQKNAEELLDEMKPFNPELKVYMGGNELLIKKNGKVIGFKAESKAMVICKAYLELFS